MKLLLRDTSWFKGVGFQIWSSPICHWWPHSTESGSYGQVAKFHITPLPWVKKPILTSSVPAPHSAPEMYLNENVLHTYQSFCSLSRPQERIIYYDSCKEVTFYPWGNCLLPKETYSTSTITNWKISLLLYRALNWELLKMITWLQCDNSYCNFFKRSGTLKTGLATITTETGTEKGGNCSLNNKLHSERYEVYRIYTCISRTRV